MITYWWLGSGAEFVAHHPLIATALRPLRADSVACGLGARQSLGGVLCCAECGVVQPGEADVVTDRDRSVVAWAAVIEAVSARDVMARFGVGRTVAYRRLAALVDAGLLARARLVYGQPALYVATADGVVFAGIGELDPARVNEASVRHWALCARLAAVLEQRERCEVWGE